MNGLDMRVSQTTERELMGRGNGWVSLLVRTGCDFINVPINSPHMALAYGKNRPMPIYIYILSDNYKDRRKVCEEEEEKNRE